MATEFEPKTERIAGEDWPKYFYMRIGDGVLMEELNIIRSAESMNPLEPVLVRHEPHVRLTSKQIQSACSTWPSWLNCGLIKDLSVAGDKCAHCN